MAVRLPPGTGLEKAMRKFALTAALGAACLGLAACGGGERNATDENAASAEGNAIGGAEAEGETSNMAGAGSAGGTAAAGGSFPKGARIVEEGGVTYRIDADGTRVRLGEGESRIVVENGVRYRVDSGGSRVRINDQGLDIDIDTPDVDLPDVDVGINKKGNPDIDVKDKKDGNDGPN
jgi:hypothetical protein